MKFYIEFEFIIWRGGGGIFFKYHRETRDDKHPRDNNNVMGRRERVFWRWGLSPVSGSKKVVVRSGLPWLILVQRGEGSTMEFRVSSCRTKLG